MSRKYLYEYDRNVKYGPASLEAIEQYEAALKEGKAFFIYPYHGYELRMVVRSERSVEEERSLYG